MNEKGRNDLNLTAAAFISHSALRLRTAAAQTAPACSNGTLVNTESGPVCGVANDGSIAYLGVPYAAPPVGPLRWRPPAPVTPWTTTLPATQAGLNCPQPPFPPGTASSAVRSEDCLTLNLYAPANAGRGLPVMVEIHGGGFLIGAPPNGAHLAAAGRVISLPGLRVRPRKAMLSIGFAERAIATPVIVKLVLPATNPHQLTTPYVAANLRCAFVGTVLAGCICSKLSPTTRMRYVAVLAAVVLGLFPRSRGIVRRS